MNINKYTEKAQEALYGAQRIAEERNHSQVDAEHLLVTLLQQDEGVVPRILEKLGIQPSQILRQLSAELEKLPKIYGGTQVSMSPRLRRMIQKAYDEANRLTDEYVSTEHLFLAIVDDQEAGPAKAVLGTFGITREKVYAALTEVRGAGEVRARPHRVGAQGQAGPGNWA